jgi:hypothetical protein
MTVTSLILSREGLKASSSILSIGPADTGRGSAFFISGSAGLSLRSLFTSSLGYSATTVFLGGIILLQSKRQVL